MLFSVPFCSGQRVWGDLVTSDVELDGVFETMLGDRRVAFERQTEGLDGLRARFSCRLVPFDLRLDTDPAAEGGPDGLRLSLEGDVGPMPFSAESPMARAALAQIVADGNAHLGGGMVIVAGRIRLMLSAPIGKPDGLVGLITAIVGLVAPWVPYLEAIAVFVAPPGEGGGNGLRSAWQRPASRKRR